MKGIQYVVDENRERIAAGSDQPTVTVRVLFAADMREILKEWMNKPGLH